MTKVDILLPYWGDVTLFKKTVESVLRQTHTDWRLLIVDDCYPSDEASEYCASIQDPRITYYRHRKNIGIANNFNYCLDQAQAQYSVILGCDDVLLPQYLQTALANIGDADIYQPSVDVIDADGKSYLPLGDRIKRLLQPKKSGFYSGESLVASLCVGNWLYFPSILWKTNTLKNYRFNPQYKIVQDVDLEFSMIIDGAVLYYDKTVTFQYRRFSESLSSKEKQGGVRFNEEKEVYDRFMHHFASIGWNKAARAARYRITSRINTLLSKVGI